MILSYVKSDGTEAKVRLKPISHAPPVTLGRDKSADVVIDDPKCSRIHAAIRYWDDIYVIRDMGSSNGTYLNGQKIEVAKLAPGDVIKIGNVEIRAESEFSRTDVTQVLRNKPEEE